LKIKADLLSEDGHRDIKQLRQAMQTSSYMKTKSRNCVPSNLPASCKTAESLYVYFAGVATGIGYSIEAVRFALQKAEINLILCFLGLLHLILTSFLMK
jgi:hypothetical protein